MVLSRSSIAILLGLGLFVLLAVSGLSAVSTIDDAARARDDARAALLTSTQLLSAVVDVETGQRGYILTGDPEYLEPYDAALARLPTLLQLLNEQTHRVEAAVPFTREIPPLVRQRIAMARQVVAVRHETGLDAARAFAERLQGRRVTDALRDRLAALDAHLGGTIARWDARANRVKRAARWNAVGFAMLGTLLILASLVMIEREHRRRAGAEAALHDANAQLEARVQARTAELEQARRQVQGFARRLDLDVENERRRLAREVHDQLGQVFTALKLTLSNVAGRYPDAAASIAQATDLLDEGVGTARRIASELRPPLLDDLGLAAAIEHRAQRFAVETGIGCSVHVRDHDGLTSERCLHLFRIVQESLTNVARHAAASEVRITGESDGSRYRLVVEDNGRGIAEPRRASLGMTSLRERALLSGGELQVHSTPGAGTRIEVRLPLRASGDTA